MKLVVVSFDDCYLSSPVTMTAAVPEGTPPRRISDKKIKKTPCPAVPLRGPGAGIHHIQVIFMVCVRTVCEPNRFKSVSLGPFPQYFKK